MLIEDFLDGIAQRVAATDVTVTTNPRAVVEPPMAVIADTGEINYHEAYVPGDLHRVDVTITVYVSKADDASGYSEVRNYRSNHGDKSIRKAVETSLGDTDPLNDITSLIVTTSALDDDGPYIAAVFQATALVPGEAD